MRRTLSVSLAIAAIVAWAVSLLTPVAYIQKGPDIPEIVILGWWSLRQSLRALAGAWRDPVMPSRSCSVSGSSAGWEWAGSGFWFWSASAAVALISLAMGDGRVTDDRAS